MPTCDLTKMRAFEYPFTKSKNANTIRNLAIATEAKFLEHFRGLTINHLIPYRILKLKRYTNLS